MRSRDELANALQEMMSQGMKGLILDLRDNAGGLLSSAIDVASFFLPGDQLLVELKEEVKIKHVHSERERLSRN